ncbi:MAG TPA: tetratricopeptide repeat protein [bacterium]|nr:tetratricopeptide repeat protein [bacterium]
MVAENDQISPYIKKVKDWKFREIISGYFDAVLMFKQHYHPRSKTNTITFSTLRKVCDILYDTKENLHLIFRHLINPKKQIFEQAHKITPSELEIAFMNNVGILFHRVMVSRELKYLLDYYEEDSGGYEESKSSLELNLRKIDELIEQGVEILIKMLENYQDNILIITYFLENKKALTKAFKNRFKCIIKILIKDQKLEDIYLSTGKYYMASGWYEKAELAFERALKSHPGHPEAKKLLDQSRSNKK